jgi:hypothetical protein
MAHQPAISISISFQHPFNRAGGRTSNVVQKMKILITIICGVSAALTLSAEPTISIAAVHPESKKILADNGGKIPDALKQDYRLLFELNSGTTDEEKPLENGLMVAKATLADQSDFIGYETLSTAWGNLGGILHLRIASRDKLMAFLAAKPKGSIALIIDDKWVFYDTGFENVAPQQGYIAIPVLDKLDEQRFQLLTIGKRGEALDEAVDKYLEKEREALSKIPGIRPLPDLDELEKTEAQQDGTGQPATRPESKSEGGDKPQPKSEGRSR